MKFTRNMRAISKLLLILLLLTALIIGAILSYLWVIGYVINLGIRVPDKTTVSITNVTFNPQNTSNFSVTLLNPSYSPAEASITQIAASPKEGFLYNISPNETYPQLPYKLPKAEEKTFECKWDWANYTGKTVKIIAFVEDGSGPTLEAQTPLVDLKIIDPHFDSTISVTHFNMTVQNSPTSVTYVNITGITVNGEDVTPLVPQVLPSLHPGDSVPFMCSWNWTDYQGKDIIISVKTLQGYVAYYPEPPERTTLPSPVVLAVTEVLFDARASNTTHFNVTVQYSEGFPLYVDITRITATLKNGVPENVTKSVPSLPHTLYRNETVTFTCIWNWTDHREEEVTITVHTLQDFTVSSLPTPTTARIILTITNVLFDVTDPSYFNITVHNSEFSLENYVNITRVTVTVENGTPENITVEPPITLYANETATFKCLWNWTNRQGQNITITVYTLQDYVADRSQSTPMLLTITNVLFNPVDTNHFIITVQNPTDLNFNITTISAKIKDGPLLNITDVEPDIPFILPSHKDLTFMCSCDWTAYKGEEVTITIDTSEGYTTSYTHTIPTE